MLPFHPTFEIGLGLAILAYLFTWYRSKKMPDKVDQSIQRLLGVCISIGILCLTFIFILSATPVLSTFGYPESVEEIESSKQLLHFLQQYNQAIVKTTEVVYWFLIIFTWWFLGGMYQFLKVIRLSGNSSGLQQ